MTAGRAARVLTAQRGRTGADGERLLRRGAALLRRAGAERGLDARHELSLVLCDNATMRRINRRWRGIDRPTDVLSFPLHEQREGDTAPPGAVGDVIVALPTLRRAARELGLPVEEHFAHLLVHGLLHLLGYDHEREAQARRMEREERRVLRALRPAPRRNGAAPNTTARRDPAHDR